MAEAIQEVIFGVSFFLLITVVVFIIAHYTYLIRKAMANNGLKPSPLFSKKRLLHSGGILIGLGVGLMISSIFTLFELAEDTADLLIWGTIILFGGLGLIAANLLEDKLGK